MKILPPEHGPPAWLTESRSKLKGGSGPTAKYPIKELVVGATLHIPVCEVGMKIITLRPYLVKLGLQLGMRFRCCQLPDGSQEIYREQ